MRVWRTNDVAAAVGLLGRAVALLPAGERPRGAPMGAVDRASAPRSSPTRLTRRWRAQSVTRPRPDRRAFGARVAVRASVRPPAHAGELALDEADRDAVAGDGDELQAAARRARARPRRDLARIRPLARVPLRGVRRLPRSAQSSTTPPRASRRQLPRDPGGGVVLRRQCRSPTHCSVRRPPRAKPGPAGESGRDRGPRRSSSARGGARRRARPAGARAVALRGGREPVGAADHLVLADASTLEAIAGNHDAAEAEARSSVEALQATGDPAYASTRAVQLADLLLDRGQTDAAEPWVELAEEEALASDVLVQFWWRCCPRAYPRARGELAEAEAMARDAVAIASLTDASCERARAHFALAEMLALAAKPTGRPGRSSGCAEAPAREGCHRTARTAPGAGARPSLQTQEELRSELLSSHGC